MEELSVNELILQIKDKDEKVRAAAWLSAGKCGAAAVKPLAAVVTDNDIEVGRAAKHAMWSIVRHAGRPGADAEKKAVEAALCELLGDDQPVAVRREVLWMLSEIGGDAALQAIRDIPGILENQDLREDARCAVQRIPGEAAVQTLGDGLENAPEDFKPALAASLRVRGGEVPGIADQKLVPTKQTKVKSSGSRPFPREG